MLLSEAINLCLWWWPRLFNSLWRKNSHSIRFPCQAGCGRELCWINDLLTMDEDQVSMLILLGLLAAFSIVDHEVFLAHLWT